MCWFQTTGFIVVILYTMCFYLKLSEFLICSYVARLCDSESPFLPKILLPYFLEEWIFLFLRHWESIQFLYICTKKKEAVIHFYFFSVTLVAKLIFLVLSVDICLSVIYSQLMIILLELRLCSTCLVGIRQSVGKKVQWGNPSKTGFRIFHVYCWLEIGLRKYSFCTYHQ